MDAIFSSIVPKKLIKLFKNNPNYSINLEPEDDGRYWIDCKDYKSWVKLYNTLLAINHGIKHSAVDANGG